MKVNKNIKKSIIQGWKSGRKERTLEIKGASMRPLITEGDAISFCSLGPAQKLKIGDIALFHRDECIIAHRVVGRTKKDEGMYYFEKGDNTFFPLLLPSDAVIGKVIKIHSRQATFNLLSWKWVCVNRLLGYYWNILFKILELLRKRIAVVLGPYQKKKLQRFFRYVQMLIKLPARVLFRNIHN